MANKLFFITVYLAFAILLMVSACSKQEESNPQPAAPEVTENQNDSNEASDSTTDAEVATTDSSESTTPADDGKGSQSADLPGESSKTNTDTAEPQANSLDTNKHKEQLSLARKSGCLACHAVDKKVIGPAWRDVSKRYVDDPNAKSRLVAKVSKGGRGNWTDVVGPAAMPPYSPRVSNENITLLVEFVLSLEAGSTK